MYNYGKPKKIRLQRFSPYIPRRLDSDRDGTPNWKDCRPLDPTRQDRYTVYGSGTILFKAYVSAKNKTEAKKKALNRDYDDVDLEDFNPTDVDEVE